MNESLSEQLKYLRLRGLLNHWDEYLKMAAQKNFSHARLLEHIIEEECKIKRENARQFRLPKAAIPEALVIETYPFDQQPKLNKKKIMALYDSLSFLSEHQNILWLGRTGCGKTGLATSFLIHAINQGYSGRYVLFAELIAELFQSVADHSEAKVLRKYFSYEILHIDEIGYVGWPKTSGNRGVHVFCRIEARWEFPHERPGWAGGIADALTLWVERLSPEDATQLAVEAGDLDREHAERIAAHAGGNPLFIVEITGMLLHEGSDLPSGPGPSAQLLPATVQAVVASRIDHLSEGTRELVRRASVFPRGTFDLSELERA